jgi:pyruvate,water dikinase
VEWAAIPAVVGTGDATTTLAGSGAGTVSCAEGDSGRIYRGEVSFHVERTEARWRARQRRS